MRIIHETAIEAVELNKHAKIQFYLELLVKANALGERETM